MDICMSFVKLQRTVLYSDVLIGQMDVMDNGHYMRKHRWH